MCSRTPFITSLWCTNDWHQCVLRDCRFKLMVKIPCTLRSDRYCYWWWREFEFILAQNSNVVGFGCSVDHSNSLIWILFSSKLVSRQESKGLMWQRPYHYHRGAGFSIGRVGYTILRITKPLIVWHHRRLASGKTHGTSRCLKCF